MKALIAILLLGAATIASGPDDPAPAADAQGSATERAEPHGAPQRIGLICAASIYHGMAEAGRRCLPGKNPAFQMQLESTIPRIDARVLQDARWTTESLARFVREQIGNEKDADFCSDDIKGLYAALEAHADEMRASVDRAIATSGPAEWGACL